ERRLLDIGRFLPPGKQRSGFIRDLRPVRIACDKIAGIDLPVEGWIRGPGHGFIQLFGRRPNVPQEYLATVGSKSDRLGSHVDVDGTREGIGDDERRTGKKRGLD